MALLPVADAIEKIGAAIAPLEAERIPLAEAGHRVLACDLAALRTQPPFDASAMDGYALKAEDAAKVPAELKVIGEAPAGRAFEGKVNSGEAVHFSPAGRCRKALIRSSFRKIRSAAATPCAF